MITVALYECEECGETFSLEDIECVNELLKEFEDCDETWWCRHCLEAYESA